MHIEPGLVDPSKIGSSYATAKAARLRGAAVLLVEPLAAIVISALATWLHRAKGSMVVDKRLCSAAWSAR